MARRSSRSRRNSSRARRFDYGCEEENRRRSESSEGKEAGQVYHQFATFCDQQLQNPDGLEDLARLQNLKKGKSDEVTQLNGLIASTKGTHMIKAVAVITAAGLSNTLLLF